jgi:SPP1 gp7 family putative phage head morphogenesis protein
MKLSRHDRVLPPVHANAGIRAAYRRKLEAMIEEMHRSYMRWVLAQYRATPPELAMDATPAADLERKLSEMGKIWAKKLNQGSSRLAKWFATATSKRSSDRLRKILKDAGISVEFQMTAAMKDAFDATVAENVGLIKSIGSHYHTEIQGSVMRSVQAGRDLGTLAKDLEKNYGVTKRRAAFISLDQNNKASATFTRVRQQEAGITMAVWLHSHAGRVPRPTHLANNGKPYDVSVGWWDPDPKVKRFIRPGELPRCRCVSKSVVRGFS